MPPEKDKLNKVSGIESEDQTLLRDDSPPIDALENELTHQFAPSDREQEQTAIQNVHETEPTKILSDTDKETNEPQIERADEQKDTNENAMHSSRLRFALVFLLIVFATGSTLLSIILLLSQPPDRGWRYSNSKNANGKNYITSQSVAENVLLNDEIISVNGAEFLPENFRETESRFKPGDRYSLGLRRDGQLLSVELVVPSLSTVRILDRYLVGLLIPALFILVGGAVFLLKPNDKLALLIVAGFCTAGVSLLQVPPYFRLSWMLPTWLINIYYWGIIFSSVCIPVGLHFFLVFPKRLSLMRRFPAIEYLLYLPSLIFILLTSRVNLITSYWMPLDPSTVRIFYLIVNIGYGLYGVAALSALLINYFQANETDRRRIRLMSVGFALAFIPTIISNTILLPLNFQGGWISFFLRLSNIFLPPTFAYAVVRHKVIPVSFVIRRGLQYLLTKNVLRLLLVLPVLGIVWNIAANPSRRLDEILLQNSIGFYLCNLIVVVLVLINRFGLREWIDRRFFREQYNQEKVLRDLTEAVKESDSLAKLSRLVSSKIQAALHSENVYLFFRDDVHQSDFSLGYSTDGSNESSANLKLAADSPILRFMQQQREAIDFPFRESELPSRENSWLRSIGANLLVPMHGTDLKLAGFFSLGEKKSEIPYTGRDKELLEMLANQIALVHENLNLKDRVRHEQRIKTEVLSRFDEGNINLLKECPKCGKCFDRDDKNCDVDKSELTFSLPVERTIENRYRLEKLLGKGGMGAVYEATDLRINRAVAVKILGGGMFGNKDALRRFEREAQTAGSLHHHNIITVHDYGVLSTEGAFLVMELIRGESLSEVLHHEGKLDLEKIGAWFSQILDGVESAHKAGIIHRDLKPENIFVSKSESGEVRLCILDFGLARMSETDLATAENVTVPGMIMGTFGYMPPEQLRGEKVDERTDLFAIGVMIYEAQHGTKPFAGKSYQELLTAMSDGIKFDEDTQLKEFYKKGLASEAENRFASASEMKHSLMREISDLQN